MTDVRARLGVRLKELRRARKMTQEGLAEKAGLSYKFIGEIERGQGNPTVDTVDALARALSVDVAVLFDLSELRASPSQGYTIPPREFLRVREALDFLEDALGYTSPPPGRRRRRART